MARQTRGEIPRRLFVTADLPYIDVKRGDVLELRPDGIWSEMLGGMLAPENTCYGYMAGALADDLVRLQRPRWLHLVKDGRGGESGEP